MNNESSNWCLDFKTSEFSRTSVERRGQGTRKVREQDSLPHYCPSGSHGVTVGSVPTRGSTNRRVSGRDSGGSSSGLRVGDSTVPESSCPTPSSTRHGRAPRRGGGLGTGRVGTLFTRTSRTLPLGPREGNPVARPPDTTGRTPGRQLRPSSFRPSLPRTDGDYFKL